MDVRWQIFIIPTSATRRSISLLLASDAFWNRRAACSKSIRMNAQKPMWFSASARPDAYPSDNFRASVAARDERDKSL
ncbi:unknown [Bacteroides sp. CAG:875]|nr:unknown [Bacteroides sp. CAG:875]